MIFLIFANQINKCNMKFKILVPLLCLCFLSSCYTSQLVSKFSGTQVELGMSQNEFIQKFGKPFNKEMAYTYDKHKRETLSEKKGNSITKNILVGKNINLPQLAHVKISSYLVPIFNPSFLIFNIPSILHGYSRKR